MTIKRLRGLVHLALAGLCAALVLNGCSLSPHDLPSARVGVTTDYRVILKFASVLNLPVGADVQLDGLRVGTVESTHDSDSGVDVLVGLNASVKIPADSHAIIRQDTLLGDTYVALTPPPPSSRPIEFLTEGSVVPQTQTTSPPQLEDTIAVLANFVNGGSIQKVQDTMATLNTTLPALQDVRSMATTVSLDLGNLAEGTAEIDRLLNGLDATSLAFVDKSDKIAGVLAPESVHYFKRVAQSVLSHVSTLLPSVGSIFIGGMWLVPMLESLADTAEAGRGIWDQAPRAADRLTEFLETTLFPWIERPAVNVTSVSTTDDRQLLDDTKTVLRMLGAIR
ncbi:MCE family protein [Gordonia jinghuaiqii]|uniref:MCE family protein n=1 Tax=Gordonia jinghuaiqii TaxID=2758710 RepID=A0A7D7R1J8_9ACTN|nr:MlaD family protein [Gordonia jinghuaiqii]MCR5978389.1 MCE family protein [Gordonia jinghuaiqii]QMT02731.1 MCE family protein [Gordonia jinghuaiqii]